MDSHQHRRLHGPDQGALVGPRRPRREAGRQGSAPLGEPARVADRGLRVPVLRRRARADLPHDGSRAGGVSPQGLRCDRGIRVDVRPGGEDPRRATGVSGSEADAEARDRPRRLVAARHDPLCQRRREGPRRVRGRPVRVRETRRRAPALRPCDAHLHVRHDGRTEGRDAHAEQLRLERRLGLLHRAVRLFRGRPLVPAPLARLRAHDRVRLLPPVVHDRVRGVDRQAARQPLGGEPAPLRRGPARLREGLRTGAGEPLEVLARQTEALREGGRGRKEGHPAARAEEDAGIRARAPALPLRAARVPKGPRRSRLAVPVRDLRRGAPRERAGGVLLGGRRRGLRGLRPHGDEPGHRSRLPVRVAARHGGQDRARSRMPYRAGRGDPDARTARHEGLFQQAEGDLRGDRRRAAGSTRATSAGSTRTASS